MRHIILALALIAPFAHAARAAEEGDIDTALEKAWRGRLVSLAPACGKKDAAWAAKARQAIALDIQSSAPQTDVAFGIKMPDPDVEEVGDGAMAQAEYLFAQQDQPSKTVCQHLASDTAISNTDDLISATGTADQNIVDPGKAPFAMPDTARLQAGWEVIAATEVLCGRRAASWSQSTADTLTSLAALAQLAAEGGVPDKAAMDTADRDAKAAILISAYYASRMMEALGHATFCKVQDKSGLASLDTALRTMAKLMPAPSPDD